MERRGLVARRLILAVALVAALLPVAGAGGAREQAPKRGGTVVYGVLVEPPCLNAYLRRCGSNFPYVGALSSLALRGAFRVGSDLEWKPDLVSHVDFTTKRPFALTYHIRPEARWSDGRPVSSRDFVFTYATVQAIKDEMWEGDAEIYEIVRSVRAVDARTVRVVLRSRTAAWRPLFGRILPAHAMRGQDVANAWMREINDPTTGRSIGNGPFLFQRWVRGRDVTFVRNPRYWKERPSLDRIVVRFVGPTGDLGVDAFERLRSGELDVVNNGPFTDEQVRELQRSDSLQVLVGSSLNWEHVDIRIGPGGHPALKHKSVRRALAYGIDRVAIARALYGRLYPPSDSAVYRNRSSHYRPNWRSYRYRPALARQLLEQAGCNAGADRIYTCAAGGRLSLRLATIAGTARRTPVVEMIRRQLREAGVEVVPVYAPRNIFFGQIVSSGGFDLAYYTWVQSPDSPVESRVLFGCQGELNYPGYCQRIASRDLDQASRILDAARQARVLNRADRQLAKDVPVIPLFDIAIAIVTRAGVRGVGVSTPMEPFADVEDWWLDE
jgi:peptide/nickel transport system substrate-binding protein